MFPQYHPQSRVLTELCERACEFFCGRSVVEQNMGALLKQVSRDTEPAPESSEPHDQDACTVEIRMCPVIAHSAMVSRTRIIDALHHADRRAYNLLPQESLSTTQEE